jgi:hypothetical protein
VPQEEGRPVGVVHRGPAGGIGEGLEVVLPRRPGREQQEHGGRLPRLVAEVVDAADRDVEEVSRVTVDPPPPVVEPNGAGEHVERLHDAPVKCGPGPVGAGPISHRYSSKAPPVVTPVAT